MRRLGKEVNLQLAAISALLVLTGSSTHRVGGGGGGGISEIAREIVAADGLQLVVAGMYMHAAHAGVQQQACSLLLAMAEACEECRGAMVGAGVREVVMAAIQCDVLCEMRISLQCARNLLRLLLT